MASGAGAASAASEPRSLSILLGARGGEAPSNLRRQPAKDASAGWRGKCVRDRHRMAVTAPFRRGHGEAALIYGGRVEPGPGGAQRRRGHARPVTSCCASALLLPAAHARARRVLRFTFASELCNKKS